MTLYPSLVSWEEPEVAGSEILRMVRILFNYNHYLVGRCNKAHCGGAASKWKTILLTFSVKMASVKYFSSLLQKHNSLFVLEGQNNAAPH
jgi:hypothetical protein